MVSGENEYAEHSLLHAVDPGHDREKNIVDPKAGKERPLLIALRLRRPLDFISKRGVGLMGENAHEPAPRSVSS